ncbi:MAG: hypothetical protein GX779_02920 [Clostridia bacterium]|jgi:hypothetical protein|nr:hypothetical protein [Clostridia bacterium]
MTYLWLAAFLTSVMLFLILVPEESIRRFHVFGMVTGFLLGLVLLVLMTPVLGYWYFVPDFFTVAGMPLFLALAWWPLEILFAHYFVHWSSTLDSLWLVLVPAAGAVLFQYLALRLELLDFRFWSLLNTFLLSVAIHFALGLYLRSQLGIRA